MILSLVSILYGFVFCFLLCSPTKFYPIFTILFAVSFIILFFSHKFVRYKNRKYYVLLIIPFLISYYICSLLIFETKNLSIEFNAKTTQMKKAVIFYCSGQMDSYSPKHASELLKSKNTLLKPIYSMQLKSIYNKLNFKDNNKDVLKVATEFKTSILNNYPYYFYIAYSEYNPNIYNAVQTAINDGCGDIKIVNYSFKKLVLPLELITQFKAHKISISITPLVYTSSSFPMAIAKKIMAANRKFDGILLINNINSITDKISALLIDNGYLKQDIIVSTKPDVAFDYFLNKNLKNIFYVNLLDDNYNYKTEIELQALLKKYTSKLNIVGINNWGYNKFLVRSSIECLRNKQ